MHYGNTIFAYHNEFSKYMKIKGATSEDVFDCLFDVGIGKFLSEKRKKYLHELFKKWDPKHLQLDADFDDYLDSHGMEDVIGDEGMLNLNMDD